MDFDFFLFFICQFISMVWEVWLNLSVMQITDNIFCLTLAMDVGIEFTKSC